MAEPNERLYFRQLLSGRDFAIGDQLATQMVNFAYAIGDRATGECVLVDPAYDPAALLAAVAADDMRVVGVLATHYHADHVGGSIFGYEVVGVAHLLEQVSCPVHVHREEVPWIVRAAGLDEADLAPHESGDVVRVGDVEIEIVHTPGHTPGSQCFLVRGRLVAGDTLFLDGCGRTDLPGSDPARMAESLRRLARIADDVVLYPGHRYSPASSAPMGEVKRSNLMLEALLGRE